MDGEGASGSRRAVAVSVEGFWFSRVSAVGGAAKATFSWGAVNAGAAGGGAARWGWSRMICCSRYSAVILSRELEATLAAMLKALALESTSLFSKPSFFEMS